MPRFFPVSDFLRYPITHPAYSRRIVQDSLGTSYFTGYSKKFPWFVVFCGTVRQYRLYGILISGQNIV